MGVLAECPGCHNKQSVKNKLCSCGKDLDKAKRGGRVKYWIHYHLPNGKQKKESLTKFKDLNPYSITDAKAALEKRRVQKRENKLFDNKPETEMSLTQLKGWFLGLKKVKGLAYYQNLKGNLERFNSEFGAMIVSKIKLADLEDYQAKRIQEGKSVSYIDQQIGAAKTMINKAFDNELVGSRTIRTFKKVRKLLKRNGNARDRILTNDEFSGLKDALSKYPHGRHVRSIVATGYYTGMRKGEILNLTWDKVDLKKRIIKLEPEDTKDHEARKIPICKELLEVFVSLPTRITGRDNYVFQYGGKPVFDIRAGLTRACDDAGIPYGRSTKNGFIFHDLRHTFNTNMRKAGIPESVIMEITGHSTREMFDRYNTIDETDIKNAADIFESYLEFSSNRG